MLRFLMMFLLAATGWAQGNIPVRQLAGKVVDLSHPVSDDFPNFEGSSQSPFQAEVTSTIEKGGYFSRRYRTQEHYATHVDAPAHFGPGQSTVDRLGPDRLFVPAVVLDIRPQGAKDADYALTAEDVLTWEKKDGAIAPGSAVLLRTGWGSCAGDMAAYRNADAVGKMHFPSFSLEAAQLLVEKRKAVAFGIDNLSVDIGRSTDYPVHRYTQAHGLYHMENLANLENLPPRVFLIVAPIKLEGGSGGQARVWAVVDR